MDPLDKTAREEGDAHYYALKLLKGASAGAKLRDMLRDKMFRAGLVRCGTKKNKE
jgi:hypothetical protein